MIVLFCICINIHSYSYNTLIYSYLWLHYLLPNVYTMKCMQIGDKMYVLFIVKVQPIPNPFNYSIKLLNKRNRVVPCILLRLIKQFLKFGQGCGHKNTSNWTIIMVRNLYDNFFVIERGETWKVLFNEAHLIIILVHAGIISLKDEFLLKVHVTFILDMFWEPLLRSAFKKTKQKKVSMPTALENIVIINL